MREETAEAIHAGGAGAQCVARSITPRGQAKRRRKHFEDVHDRLQRKFSDLVDMMTAHAEEGDVERAPTEASNSSTSFDEIDWEFEEEMKRRHERLLQVKSRAWATQLEKDAAQKENREIERELLKEQVQNRVLAVEEVRLRISVLELRPEVAAMARKLKAAYLKMINRSHDQNGRPSGCPTPTSSSSAGRGKESREPFSPSITSTSELEHAKDSATNLTNENELETLRYKLAELKRMLQESSEACREEEEAVTALQEQMSTKPAGGGSAEAGPAQRSAASALGPGADLESMAAAAAEHAQQHEQPATAATRPPPPPHGQMSAPADSQTATEGPARPHAAGTDTGAAAAKPTADDAPAASASSVPARHAEAQAVPSHPEARQTNTS